MKLNLWLTLVTCLAYCVDRELWKAIDYLKEQVRVLKEQQEKDKRILLNDRQRIRLAAKAIRLTRELLEATTVLFTPDTILGWYRKLIAEKYDGSENCKNPGRPRISQEITDLVIRFKKENPHWGYTRIRDYIVHLGYKVATRKVEILGIRPQPNGPWMEQIARNVSGEGGFLAGKKYLIHDRDPLYAARFESILKAAGVEPVKLPPRSPNLNAHAERFVRSARQECLNHLILSSEEQLRYVLTEYLKYYHHERIHQGVNRIIEPQHEGNQGEIICIERLGGLLKSYHRKAA